MLVHLSGRAARLRKLFLLAAAEVVKLGAAVIDQLTLRGRQVVLIRLREGLLERGVHLPNMVARAAADLSIRDHVTRELVLV